MKNISTKYIKKSIGIGVILLTIASISVLAYNLNNPSLLSGSNEDILFITVSFPNEISYKITDKDTIDKLYEKINTVKAKNLFIAGEPKLTELSNNICFYYKNKKIDNIKLYDSSVSRGYSWGAIERDLLIGYVYGYSGEIFETLKEMDFSKLGIFYNEEEQMIQNTNTVAAETKGIKITELEIVFDKIATLYDAKSDVFYEKELSKQEIINTVLKQKVLIADALSKGIKADANDLEILLTKMREKFDVDDNGIITNDETLKNLLNEVGITYNEYEQTILKRRAEYSLIFDDYAKCIYDILLTQGKNPKLNNQMVDDYIQTIIDVQ